MSVLKTINAVKQPRVKLEFLGVKWYSKFVQGEPAGPSVKEVYGPINKRMKKELSEIQ
ncbi:hypothetical protein QE152_g36052, partial [Popillia japonica]